MAPADGTKRAPLTARRRRHGRSRRKPPVRRLGRFQPRWKNHKWKTGWRHTDGPHLSRYGFAKAPRNTTSFLIKDSEDRRGPVRSPPCSDSDDDDDLHLPPSFKESKYFDREFVQIYEDHQEERLQNMSNVELAEEILNLEDKIEELKTILDKLHTQPTRTLIRPPGFDPYAEKRMIAAYSKSIEKITAKNLFLEAENEAFELRMLRGLQR